MQVIAVLIASTSKNTGWVSADSAYFLNMTIPSILDKASGDFEYKFYIGVDHDDDFFIENESTVKDALKLLGIDFKFFFVQNELHKPCPVWNFLFEKAWEDGCDYFLQTGDDLEFLDPFDSKFVEVLKSNDGFGLVGGVTKYGPFIVTQAFVSRKHMELFGFLFPPELPDWGSDNWISHTYRKYGLTYLSNHHRVRNNFIAGVNESRYVISSDFQEKLYYSIDKYHGVIGENYANNKSDRA